MAVPVFDPSQPFEAVGAPAEPAAPQPSAAPEPAPAAAPAAVPKFDPNIPSFDPNLPFEEVEQPNFAQNVGRMASAGAGAVAGAVSEASPKLREGIIQGASRIPDITFDDVKKAITGSLTELDQATLNIPAEFLDIVKGLGRVPDHALQGIINMWNASGKYDVNLNPKDDPSAQIGFSPTKLADKVLPMPETPSGKAALLAGEFAIGAKGVGAAGKAGTAKELTEAALVKQTTKGIKKSGNEADVIKQYLGLDDLSQVKDFSSRFPNMAEHGATTGTQASKIAGKMYDDVPKLDGFQSHLDVTKLNPKTGKNYGDLIEEFMLSTPPEMLPARLLKKLRPGPGPYTVADRYLATKALREIARTSNKPAFKVHVRKYIRAMRDLELIPGQADDAAKVIAKADGLYAEAMAAEKIGGVVTEATKKGSTYTKNVIGGTQSVKASDVLKGMDQIGDAQMEKMLGQKWRVVRSALRKLGDDKITKKSFGTFSKLLGPVFNIDWRILSTIGGGALVGTTPYHAIKAVKAVGK